MISKSLYIFTGILFFVFALFAQETQNIGTAIDSFPLSSSSKSFILSKYFVLASSIKVQIDSVTLSSPRDFSFQRNSNSIVLSQNIVPDSSKKTITISYAYLIFTLKKSYSVRSLLIRKDDNSSRSQLNVITQPENVFSNIFNPDLSKSGSITRGFTVGSNRDLTVSSGFRLQLAGKLSDDINILAALTDENIPIQPQGNTQTLQELDNVFVEIKSPKYSATLGDFYFTSKNGKFTNINRKLQGAMITAKYDSITPKTQLSFVGATSRGKYHSNQFIGIEGVQGPYRLSGKNNERNIIIIAGTEKVYVDGEKMIRGESNDYSIEYGSAEITFSTKKLITGASRITIDFEYTDRQFTRNVFGLNTHSVVSNSVTLFANFYQEGDDPDSPIDISLTDSDKQLLAQSGNSIPYKSGVVFVGVDSNNIGKGTYQEIDSLIDGVSTKIYRYQLNTTQSLFNVAFSNMGLGKGEYTRIGPGKYEYVGKNSGTYSPVIFLPSAQLQQSGAVGGEVKLFNYFMIDGEFAFSKFDQNRFSSIGDGNNTGNALNYGINFNSPNISIGEMNIGVVELSLRERYKDKRFTNFDRIDEVEFGRKWSTDSLSTSSIVDENIREGSLKYVPREGIIVGGEAGSLERTNQFSSQRVSGFVNLTRPELPKLNYIAENITGKENSTLLSNSWFRDKADVEYNISKITPSIHYESEKRIVTQKSLDSLTSSSYSYTLLAPKMKLADVYGFDLSSEYELRNDKSLFLGKLIPQAASYTQSYEVTVHEIQNFSAASSIILRKKEFEQEFRANNVNQQTILIKTQARYRPFSQGLDIDANYDVATQRTAKLERVFFKVRKGEGQYIWIDANGNGKIDVTDEREFRPDRFEGEYVLLTLSGDELYPIINLKTSSRIRVTPSRFIHNPISTFQKAISIVSTETFLRIEERSSEPKTQKIYLLNQNYFLNPSTTILGSQFIQQDIFLFENNSDYSFRFRFNQRKGLNQFSSGLERNYSRERSLRIRFQISDDIANQSDLISKNDNALSSSLINQSREISSTSIATDLSYRPEQKLEIGIKLETSQSDDNIVPSIATSNFNSQTLRVVYALLGNGQARFEVSREEILLGSNPANYLIPYELTGGRDEGKTFSWTATSEYRLGSNVQFSLQYNGRTRTRLPVIHTGRMEVRAFF
jgi:hypothetical protein